MNLLITQITQKGSSTPHDCVVEPEPLAGPLQVLQMHAAADTRPATHAYWYTPLAGATYSICYRCSQAVSHGSRWPAIPDHDRLAQVVPSTAGLSSDPWAEAPGPATAPAP